METNFTTKIKSIWLGIFIGIIIFIVIAIVLIAILTPKIDDAVESQLNEFLIGEINEFSPGVVQNAYVCTLRFGGVI